MKKIIYTLVTALTLSFTASISSADAKNKAPKNETELTQNQQARMQEIELRVKEIKDMDKSNLSSSERKELRNELTDMKKEAKALSGGVYLSVGAIIIIILLLILIL